MSDSLDALRRTFAMLCAKYRVTLPETVDSLDNLWGQIVAGELPASRLADLVQTTHNIAGTGMTFGFSSAGEVAREIELYLQPIAAAGRSPDAAERERVAALLAALKSAAR